MSQEDFQEEDVDYSFDKRFAPITSHELIRTLLEVTASKNCHTESCDVDNAYLFEDIDILIWMKKSCDPSVTISMPGYDRLL